MTRFLLFITGFFCILSIRSQNRNYATHGGIDRPNSIVTINGKSCYAQTISENCCSDILIIKGVGENFADTWQKAIAYHESNFLNKLLVTHDKHVLVLGYSRGCDLSQRKYFLVKLDTLGQTVFSHTIQSNEWLWDMTEYTDSTFYMVSATILYQYNKAGVLNWALPTSITAQQSIYTLANGNLLIGSSDTITELNTNLTIVRQKPAGLTYSKYGQTHSGNIFALGQGALHLLDTALNYVSSANTGLPVDALVKDFDVYRDTVYVTGYFTTNNTPFVARFDTLLNQLGSPSTANYANVKPTGIAAGKNRKLRVLTGGNSNANTVMTFAGLYEMPFSGNFSSKYDVGVSTSTLTSASYFQVAAGKYYAIVKMDVKVNNYGNDTIKSFYLNHYAKDFLCLVMLHKKCLVNLAPGQSMVVPTGSFYILPIQTNSLGLPVAPSLNICVFTTIPNDANDVDVSNDGACLTVPVTLGLNKNHSIPGLTLFPNPVNHSLEIRGELKGARLTVMNLLGQVLMHKGLEVNGANSINLTELPSGIYLVEIETESAHEVRRIVKE